MAASNIEHLTINPLFDSAKGFRLVLLCGIGSNKQINYRELIRQILFDLLVKEGLSPKPSLLDLNQLPTCENTYLSISHCQDHSLIAWGPRHLGCDIENIDRIRAESVARIASENEVTNAPSPALLWTAKESAFKAISNSAKDYSGSAPQVGSRAEHPNFQPKLLSSVEILAWQKDTMNQSYTYKAKNLSVNKVVGLGQNCIKLKHSISFFVTYS